MIRKRATLKMNLNGKILPENIKEHIYTIVNDDLGLNQWIFFLQITIYVLTQLIIKSDK